MGDSCARSIHMKKFTKKGPFHCIMLLMRIALCVLSLTRALLQIHYGFTTILCLGSAFCWAYWTRGWMWDSDESRDLTLPPLRGIAAFCRYSCVGNLDVRGALIFERPSYVEGSRCMGFRVDLTLFLVQNQA